MKNLNFSPEKKLLATLPADTLTVPVEVRPVSDRYRHPFDTVALESVQNKFFQAIGLKAGLDFNNNTAYIQGVVDINLRYVRKHGSKGIKKAVFALKEEVEASISSLVPRDQKRDREIVIVVTIPEEVRASIELLMKDLLERLYYRYTIIALEGNEITIKTSKRAEI